MPRICEECCPELYLAAGDTCPYLQTQKKNNINYTTFQGRFSFCDLTEYKIIIPSEQRELFWVNSKTEIWKVLCDFYQIYESGSAWNKIRSWIRRIRIRIWGADWIRNREYRLHPLFGKGKFKKGKLCILWRTASWAAESWSGKSFGKTAGSGSALNQCRSATRIFTNVLKHWFSAADPDPGSGAFLTPGSEIREKYFPDPGSNSYFWELTSIVLG